MARVRAREHDPAMQVLEAGAAHRSRLPILPAVGALALGVLLVGAGVAAAWTVLSSSVLTDVSNLGRGQVVRPAVGTIAFALAFLVPAILVVFGLARLAGVIERASPRRRRRGPAAAFGRRLPDEFAVVASLRTPDGRRVPEVVVGPNGLVIVEPLPPLRAARIRGHSWEVRLSSGRWMPIENPLDRASRDAERVRRWLGSEWESWSPRVYAVVVADGHAVQRLPDVAVVTRAELGAFLLSMPASRSMTPDRRAAVLELFGAA
jgi:hypothetical protein